MARPDCLDSARARAYRAPDSSRGRPRTSHPDALDALDLPAAALELGHPIRSIGDLHHLATRRQVDQLWILPGAVRELGLPATLPPAPAPELARFGIPHPFVPAAGHGCTPPGLAPWIVSRNGSGRVDFAFPGWDDATDLRDAATAGELLKALELYHQAVGIPYSRSPGATSGRLIRSVHQRGIPLEPSAEPPPPALEGGTETDYHWTRPLELLEQSLPWVYAVDANGLYLAAASSVELGFGEPEHIVGHKGPLAFDARLPGYWRAEISYYRPDSPIPKLQAGRDHLRAGPDFYSWHATPTLELAEEAGALGAIREAWIWPRHHRYLGPWYERLRDARAALGRRRAEPAYALALGLVKRTYTMGIGYLAGSFAGAGDPLYRPDWRHQVIARARANLYRRVAKLPLGARPFAVDVDTLYVASEHESTAAAFPGLPLGDGLGQFKTVGRAPLPLALEALESRRPLLELRKVIRGSGP